MSHVKSPAIVHPVRASGIALAAAAAFLSVAPLGAVAAEQGAEAIVHCHGVNACRERGNCRSPDNACKGHNACKGQSYVPVTQAVCDQLGGVVRED
jgi:hypothetical protein